MSETIPRTPACKALIHIRARTRACNYVCLRCSVV